ncbi:hypothetical protein N7E81_16655 [Reichenbachiella carrageenanivorans]|uniref:Lipoprotein n=1 Tax=Reichenbachiella carrageenanivorans TaxID=2979869 RepID=A0ABY6CYI9_9BACT|nr:hypothetical protein [Reichenbachiella carrageenanivorans]UXX78986.1 hypothetical protein N7E81_16655 [Reichenbachiella carrageenanivorans]
MLVGITSICRGQESSKYLKLKNSPDYRTGYVFILDSTKIEGLIKHDFLNEAANYSVVKFIHKDGSKEKYYPNNSISFGYSYHKFISDGSSFLELIQAGKNISLYKNVTKSSWSAPGAPGMSSTTYSSTFEHYYVKRDSEDSFKEVQNKKFKEVFSEYFYDCEALSVEISKEELGLKDIKTIVRKYNACKLNR